MSSLSDNVTSHRKMDLSVSLADHVTSGLYINAFLRGYVIFFILTLKRFFELEMDPKSTRRPSQNNVRTEQALTRVTVTTYSAGERKTQCRSIATTKTMMTTVGGKHNITAITVVALVTVAKKKKNREHKNK